MKQRQIEVRRQSVWAAECRVSEASVKGSQILDIELIILVEVRLCFVLAVTVLWKFPLDGRKNF